MSKLSARATINEVLLEKVHHTVSKQEGGPDDFSFTRYTVYKGSREDLVDEIERALFAHGLLAVNITNVLEREGFIQ